MVNNININKNKIITVPEWPKKWILEPNKNIIKKPRININKTN